MLKKLLFLFVVIFLVLIFAIVNAPAKLLAVGLDYGKQQGLLSSEFPDITFTRFSGTLWQGQSEAIVKIDNNDVDLGLVTWSIDIISLLDSSLNGTVLIQAVDHQFAGEVNVFESGDVVIKNAEGYFPLLKLEPWVPLLVKGDLSFTISTWVFNNNQLKSLDGVVSLDYIDWLGGDYAMPLGNYMAEVSVVKNDIAIKLSDLGARLGIDGTIFVKPDRSYQFKATLMPQVDLAPEVKETLTFFGKRNNAGEILINQRGRL